MVERTQHIVETGLAMLATRSVPTGYWDDAFLTTCHLINRMPTPIFNQSSLLKNFLRKSQTTHYFAFLDVHVGLYFVPIIKINCKKHSHTYVFIRYGSLSHYGYKCLDPISGRIYLTRHVIFDEQNFPFQKQHDDHQNTQQPTQFFILTSLHLFPSQKN